MNRIETFEEILSMIEYCEESPTKLRWLPCAASPQGHRRGFAGGISGKRTALVKYNGNRYCCSRLIAIIKQIPNFEKLNDGYRITFLDRDHTNLSYTNLEVVRDSEIGIKYSNNEYPGATFKKKLGRWVAQYKVNNRKRHIGVYDTAEAASRAYMEKIGAI